MEDAVSPTYRATFTNDSRSVALARSAVGRFARICGFSEPQVADIRGAAGEALINAAQYGRALRGGGFSVNCVFEDGELHIEVQDSGRGFQAPTTGGFGTVIMRSLMNSVEYSRGGTRVRLVKRIGSRA